MTSSMHAETLISYKFNSCKYTALVTCSLCKVCMCTVLIPQLFYLW